jgi:hypothetical protein
MTKLFKQTLITSVLSIFLINGAIADPSKKPYGLGIPASSGTGGAVRSLTSSLVVPLAPEDGGRTASEQPTFYWYLSTSNNFPYKTIFELRDSTDRDNAVVFKTEGTATNSGLYKVTLPSSVRLMPEKVYVWQLRLRGTTASSNLQAIGSIVLTKVSGEMQKAIAKATTSLEKAKVFSNYGYWFDALDLNTKQIETEPQNQTALKMRSEMMLEIFTTKNGDSQVTVKNLVDKINATKIMELLSSK